MLITIAWKNIWRNKLRSSIVLSAVAIGLFGGLFGSALLKGMASERIRMAISNETAHAQIHHPEFLLNKELDDTLHQSQEILYTLDTSAAVAAWSARVRVTGMATSATNGTGVNLMGVDPLKEKLISGIWQCIPDSQGSWFGDRHKNTVVAGKKLIDKLNLGYKSKLILTFQDIDGNLVTAAFKIGGVFSSGNTSFDETTLFVKADELRALTGLNNGQIHEIALLHPNNSSETNFVQMLTQAGFNISFMTWKEILPDLGLMDEFMMQWLYIIMTIILLALCFGIVNTMMMAILERTREIGMLMAVGMSRVSVFTMIMLETILLSLTGALIGMIISRMAILYYAKHGIFLAGVAEGMEDMGYNPVLYPELPVNFYTTLTLLVVAVAIAASVMPARRALKLVPVEAIRTT